MEVEKTYRLCDTRLPILIGNSVIFNWPHVTGESQQFFHTVTAESLTLPHSTVWASHTVLRGNPLGALELPLSTVWSLTLPLSTVWGLTRPLGEVWEAQTSPYYSVRGLHCTKGQCESFRSNSVDKLSTFSRYVWPVKSHTVTDWCW